MIPHLLLWDSATTPQGPVNIDAIPDVSIDDDAWVFEES